MRLLLKWLSSLTGRALILTLAVWSVIGLLSFMSLGQNLENHALDLIYRLRPGSPQPQDLLIVGIDEPSFKEIGQPWPWPRRMHAALVDRLAQMGARLIIFDILFAEPTTPEDDELLARALHRAGNVILGQTLEVTKDPRFARRMLIKPLEPLRQAARDLGLMMVTPDADGVVRHFCLRLDKLETLAAAAVQNLTPRPELPTDLSGLINYVGPPRSLDTVSYYQVLDPEHPLPENRVRGRLVLVGWNLEASVTPQQQADSFNNPFFASTGQFMSGVEIHGQIIYTLLTKSWGQELGPGLRLAVSFLLIASCSLLLGRLRLAAALAVLMALILLTWGTSLGLFVSYHLWLPPVLTSLGLVLVYLGHISWKYLSEFREKRWLRQAFGRYVSAALVEAIIAHPERLELGGEEAEVTVLFADLAGFTGLAETMPPKSLIQLLNEYFSTMTEIILARHGTLDKFIGDALMAVWGAPVAMADHARLACQAALEMQEAMIRLQEGWSTQGLPRLAARIGLHSGRVLAGNIGSKERFDYTVMGDTVNLASRLEGVNKLYGTEIILSEDTYQRAADYFLFRALDRVQVKGRWQPVTIYELLGPSPQEGEPGWLQAFAAGRAAYLARNWDQAQEYFQAALRLKPEDGPTQALLNRCQQHQQQPPGADWQGVLVLTEK
ncbi:MAG: CHASE2 domain-containing protein [Desulfobacca sp.]|nr:CHASE2 domain-containing protein [Desulfobacca sp.]